MIYAMQVHQKVTTDIEQIETELVSSYNQICVFPFLCSLANLLTHLLPQSSHHCWVLCSADM